MKSIFCLLLLLPMSVWAKNADAGRLREHVMRLVSGPGFRNIDDTARLNAAARYIYDELQKTGATMSVQPFELHGKTYYNIIGSYGPADRPRIIVGAHYDVCEKQQGADDNASGVAGILELSRLLGTTGKTLSYRIDIVAYTLEEPPTFRTPAMGSAVHAKMMHDSAIDVRGMISVEMIGFYSDAKNSQRYPLGLFKLFYGSRGNYVTVVRKFSNGSFPRRFTRAFKRAGGDIVVKSFKGWSWIPGLDFSDHLNYWAYGWPALMLTDTSFYRNSNYHEKTDTPETLDYDRMKAVVDKLYESLVALSS